MKISMFQASVPVFARQLTSLATILEKAAVHAEAHKIDPTVLLASRLYPDMLPLAKQVQIATDHAKGAAARLSGVEPPKFEDTESSFADLLSRVRKTIAYIESVPAAQIDSSDERPITVAVRTYTLNFLGVEYLLSYALPNFYFHVTTAYAILRHSGVEIGKKDFLGAI